MKNEDDLLEPTRAAMLAEIADLEALRDDTPDYVHPAAPRHALRRARELFSRLVGRELTPEEVEAHAEL